jgi:hypothetical protein
MLGICRYCGSEGIVTSFWTGHICAACARVGRVTYDDSRPGEFRILFACPAGTIPIVSYLIDDLPVAIIGPIARLETVRLRHRLEQIAAESAPSSRRQSGLGGFR